MSVAAVNQGAVAPSEKNSGWSKTIQAICLILVIGFVTTGAIKATHKNTPIKNAIAGLIRMIPFLAPFVLLDDGYQMTEAENCECECLPDGTATAVVDGAKVSALNHEFN